MGYLIEMVDENFRMSNMTENTSKKVVKALFNFLDSDPRLFHWVKRDKVRDLTLEELFGVFGWRIERTGNLLHSLEFLGDKMASYKTFFEVLAPFVSYGSYIEMRGEDGKMWRWIFNGTECEEIKPKIIWERPLKPERGK